MELIMVWWALVWLRLQIPTGGALDFVQLDAPACRWILLDPCRIANFVPVAVIELNLISRVVFFRFFSSRRSERQMWSASRSPSEKSATTDGALSFTVRMCHLCHNWYITLGDESFHFQEHVKFETFMKSIFDCILPGSLNLLVVFYSFLHAWMNAFAEMLRFAVRFISLSPSITGRAALTF